MITARVSDAISWINLYLWSLWSLSWQSRHVSLSQISQNRLSCSWGWTEQKILLADVDDELWASDSASSFALIVWSFVIFNRWWAWGLQLSLNQRANNINFLRLKKQSTNSIAKTFISLLKKKKNIYLNARVTYKLSTLHTPTCCWCIVTATWAFHILCLCRRFTGPRLHFRVSLYQKLVVYDVLRVAYHMTCWAFNYVF